MDNVGVKVSNYLIETLDTQGGKAYVHWCPACKCCHSINVEKETADTGALWSFNQQPESPTFSPSIRVGEWQNRCHYTIENGAIVYHGGSMHAYAGRTVPMQEFPQHVLDAYERDTRLALEVVPV